VRTETGDPSLLAVDIDPDVPVCRRTIVSAWVREGFVGVIVNDTALVASRSIDLLLSDFAQIDITDIDYLVAKTGFDLDFR
jgi:hypothetical protein